MNRLVVAVLLFAFAWSLQARVYKSVDADGNVTYSQTKPIDSNNVETIKTPKPKPAPPAPNKVESGAEDETTEQKPEISPEEKERLEAENAEIKKQNCQNSKKRLAELNAASGRLRITDDNGDLKWASDEEVQARKDHLKGNVDKWCK